MPFKYASLRARLDANVELVADPAFERPHQLWTGACDSGGYGKFMARSRYRFKHGRRRGQRKLKTHGAHRVSLAEHLGIPLWRLNHVAHVCDLKTCIEPSHLWSTTQLRNVQDCVAKGRHGNQHRAPVRDGTTPGTRARTPAKSPPRRPRAAPRTA